MVGIRNPPDSPDYCHILRSSGTTEIVCFQYTGNGEWQVPMMTAENRVLCMFRRSREKHAFTAFSALFLKTSRATIHANSAKMQYPTNSASWPLSRMRFGLCCFVAGAWFTIRSFSYLSLFLTVGCLFWIVRIASIRRAFKRSCEFGVRALVVLGSGGHTAEMMTMMSSLVAQKMKFRSILYAAAATDGMSRFKAENSGIGGDFVVVPRAREVGQSYISSALTTVWAFLHSFICVMRYQPQLFLCNGPGTCVPFAIAVCICRSDFICSIAAQPDVPAAHQSLSDQVFRTVPLLHSLRRIVCPRQVAVSVGSHHVLRRRQVCCSVGRIVRSLSPRNLCRCLVLTGHAV